MIHYSTTCIDKFKRDKIGFVCFFLQNIQARLVDASRTLPTRAELVFISVLVRTLQIYILNWPTCFLLPIIFSKGPEHPVNVALWSFFYTLQDGKIWCTFSVQNSRDLLPKFVYKSCASDLPSFDNENVWIFPQGCNSLLLPIFLPEINYIRS